MSHLIQAILQYSSIQTEGVPFEPVSLNRVLEEVCSSLELLISESGTEIVADDLPVVEAVPFQMQQLFQNLISNSIKYRKEETPAVIRISSGFVEDGAVMLSFLDNGIGFDRKDEQKIFGMFQRLNSGKKAEGTGIGLALCKKIVEQHKGMITVQSEPGKGTEFRVTLPLHQQKDFR